MILPFPSSPGPSMDGLFKGHPDPLHPPDPHSLCVLDGPVQGAEKCATFLHHTVEMGLVEEVTLGITEVLGSKPSQRSSPVRGGPWPPGWVRARPPVPYTILCRTLTCGDTPSRALTISLEPVPSQPCPRKVRAPQRDSPPLLS